MDSRWFTPTMQGSSMGMATLAFPWHTTPLGSIETWGESLRQMARMCFSTNFPVLIAWGPELTMIYNDAYREILGTHKRLNALGAPLSQVWEEVWDDVGPLVETVMTTRLPVWAANSPMMVNRSGFDEEVFFTFSYSPLVDDTGQVAGVLDIATETTEQVVSQRRLALIDTLHAHLQHSTDTALELAGAAVKVLDSSPDLHRSAILVRNGSTADLQIAGYPDLVDQVTLEVAQHVMTTRTATVVGSTVVVPLSATEHGDADGVLAAQAGPTRPFDASLRSFAMLAASAIAGALRSATIQLVTIDYLDAKARVLELENIRARQSSIALQHSLLTAPPEPDHLHLVVRYQPAASDLEVGGDWYDAFLTKDGATTLVIGDVTGHDHHAAAAMGQLRGLIRAIAFDSGLSPARVLERTDEAIKGLNLSRATTATAVLARIEQDLPDRIAGMRTVRWSNAGHLYPILIRANGNIEILNRKNDLLLGIAPDVPRTEHEICLHPKDTLFFYTDGLIERRRIPLTDSTALLVQTLQGGHEKTLDELADHVLGILAPGEIEDDVALVLVRPYPEDQPRPPEAGPRVNIPTTLDPAP